MLTIHMKTGYKHHKQLQVKLVCYFSPPLCCVFGRTFPTSENISFTCKYFIRAASAEVLLQFLLLVAFK